MIKSSNCLFVFSESECLVKIRNIFGNEWTFEGDPKFFKVGVDGFPPVTVEHICWYVH